MIKGNIECVEHVSRKKKMLVEWKIYKFQVNGNKHVEVDLYFMNLRI